MIHSKNPFEVEKSALISYEKEAPNKEVPPQFNPYVFNGGNIAGKSPSKFSLSKNLENFILINQNILLP